MLLLWLPKLLQLRRVRNCRGVLRRYSEHSRVNFTFESDAEPLISPSPAVTLGFHRMRNVTAK